MGYYQDPYVPILVKASIATSASTSASLAPFESLSVPSSGGTKSTGWDINESSSASRSALHIMAPLMNRGYYARVQAIRASLRHFLANLGGTQIVSLGAGFDSTYFLLKVRLYVTLMCIELRFQGVNCDIFFFFAFSMETSLLTLSFNHLG
jgi:hypothetical protein